MKSQKNCLSFFDEPLFLYIKKNKNIKQIKVQILKKNYIKIFTIKFQGKYWKKTKYKIRFKIGFELY